jgi:hypothetical protein
MNATVVFGPPHRILDLYSWCKARKADTNGGILPVIRYLGEELGNEVHS